MTRKELLDEAKQLGIVGRNRMSKNDLAVAVNKKQHRRRDAEIVGNAQRAKARARAGTHTVTARRSSKLPSQTGLQALQEAVSKSVTDTFEVGTVIRWESDAGYAVYTYAAIKSPVGWFTTAKDYNRFVHQQVSFEELLEVLSRAETRNVAVATEWHEVN